MSDENAPPLSRKRLALIAGICFAQGIALYLLQRATKSEGSVLSDALACGYTLATFLPFTLLYLLSGEGALTRRVRIGVWLQALLLTGMAYYTAALQPDNARDIDIAMFPAFVLSAWVFWFISLTQILALAGPKEERYVRFYRCNQDIVFLGIFASVLTGAFWLVLMVWGLLFKMVGAPFFWNIFTSPLFFLPATTTAFGLALTLARHRYGRGTPLTQRLFALFGYLLPLAAGVSLAFLSLLVFTGLDKLWDTRMATTLLLWLQILVLIFTNAAYQDGSAASPYPRWLRRSVTAALVLLPAYSALALYALSLRIGEYGWTLDRVWAVLVALIVTGLTVGYAAASLTKGPWMKKLERINLAGAWVVMALLVLTHSPVLSPAHIAAASQEKRVLSGKVTPEKFDYKYLRFSLGTAGTEALSRLAALQEHPHALTIRMHAVAAINLNSRYSNLPATALAEEDFYQRVDVHPKDTKLDPAFVTQMLAPPESGSGRRMTLHHAVNNACVKNACHLFVTDLNHDGAPEYIFLGTEFNPPVFEKKEGGWIRTGTMSTNSSFTRPRLKSEHEDLSITQVRPAWDDIIAGESRLRFNPVKE